MKFAHLLAGMLALVLTIFVTPISAHAGTMGITYYTISSADPDANTLCCGTYNNEVQNGLGVHGLPVLNTAAYGCLSNCFSGAQPTNLLSDGEITYWSPSLNTSCAGGTSCIIETGTATLGLPICITDCSGSTPSNFFPPNGTGSFNGGANGYQAALLSANLDLTTTEQLSFSIGADDMAFAYLNGQVVCDLGGVHGSTPGSCVSPTTYSPGNYSLQVFFVDINQVQSGLYFDVTSQDVIVTPPTPVPEAPSIAILLGGLGLIGGSIYFGRKQTLLIKA